MEEKLVSVVITTYKRPADMVKRAITSVTRQSYNALEIIVIDDSPENFDDRILVEFMIKDLNDDRISYIKHTKNLGANAARNTGIRNSKGDFIAFLDDDDEWDTYKIEKQMLKMANPDVGLVYCKYMSLDDETQKTSNHMSRVCYSGKVFDLLMERNFISSTSFALIRKECFNICGLFDLNQQSSQDYEMWLRIAEKYEVDYVNEPLVTYHYHSQERISDNHQKRIQGFEYINHKYADYLNKHKKTKSKRLMILVPIYLDVGNKKKAFTVYCQVVKLNPLNILENLKCLCIILKDIVLRTNLMSSILVMVF